MSYYQNFKLEIDTNTLKDNESLLIQLDTTIPKKRAFRYIKIMPIKIQFHRVKDLLAYLIIKIKVK